MADYITLLRGGFPNSTLSGNLVAELRVGICICNGEELGPSFCSVCVMGDFDCLLDWIWNQPGDMCLSILPGSSSWGKKTLFRVGSTSQEVWRKGSSAGLPVFTPGCGCICPDDGGLPSFTSKQILLIATLDQWLFRNLHGVCTGLRYGGASLHGLSACWVLVLCRVQAATVGLFSPYWASQSFKSPNLLLWYMFTLLVPLLWRTLANTI